MEKIIPMGSPLRELVLQSQVSMIVDQRVERSVSQELDYRPPIWVFLRDDQLELKDRVAIVPFVDEERPEPHYFCK